MSEAIVAPAIHYNTVDPVTGEVTEHRADMTGEERMKQLAEEEEQARKKRERERFSPYDRWAQLNLEQIRALQQLTRESPRATEILFFLLDKMDGYNALVCSHTVFEEALGMSRATVSRAVKTLKDRGFIDVKKSGSTNVYLTNANVVWKSWGSNFKYAEFNARVIVSETEQDDQPAKPAKVKTKKRATAEIVPETK